MASPESKAGFGRKIEGPMMWGGGLAAITGVLINAAPLAAIGMLGFIGGAYLKTRK